MKKILLLSFVLTSVFSTAQVLQSADFNTLTVGNVGTDYTGVAAGQGSFLTFASNGTATPPATATTTNASNTNFQIVAAGNNSTNGLLLQGPNGNSGGRYMWKDGLATSWAARTTGNDIIEVEVDFYTGAATTSTGFTGIYLYDDQFEVINGFIYTNNTRLLRGIARLTNAGTIDTFTINLATGGLILTSNTWYRLGFGYNTVTGQPTWRLNTSTGTSSIAAANWATPTASPFEIDFASEGGTNNVVSYNGVFDNYVAKASATDTLLGINEVIASKDSFKVFPNPTEGIVNISTSDNIKINSVSITDMKGRVVKEFSNINDQINISDLSAGMYMMNISSDQGSVTKKIVKQ